MSHDSSKIQGGLNILARYENDTIIVRLRQKLHCLLSPKSEYKADPLSFSIHTPHPNLVPRVLRLSKGNGKI